MARPELTASTGNPGLGSWPSAASEQGMCWMWTSAGIGAFQSTWAVGTQGFPVEGAVERLGPAETVSQRDRLGPSKPKGLLNELMVCTTDSSFCNKGQETLLLQRAILVVLC